MLAIGEEDDGGAGCEGIEGGFEGGIEIGGGGVGGDGELGGDRTGGVLAVLPAPPKSLGGGTAEGDEFDIVLGDESGEKRGGAGEEQGLEAIPS